MRGIRLSVPEVAPVVGMSQGELRKKLRQKQVPYGVAVIIGHKRDGTPKFRYDIWLPKVLEYTGLKEWPGSEAAAGERKERTSHGKGDLALNIMRHYNYCLFDSTRMPDRRRYDSAWGICNAVVDAGTSN